MEIDILQQPFDSLGALSRLGPELIRQLLSGDYTQVHIFSAFVTSSGVQRLGPALQSVTRLGGEVIALIGIDNRISSVQAVTDLHAAGVRVLGFHTGGSILYHPKAYLLRGADRGWISVGSSNLTGDGMFRNIETNTIVQLNLSLRADAQLMEHAMAWFEHFRRAYSRNALPLTRQMLSALVESGVLVDEVEMARRSRSRDPRGRNRQRAERGEAVPRFVVPALPPTAAQQPVRRRGRNAQAQELRSAGAPTRQTRFFAMTLSAHDASKKTGMPGTPELSLPRPARDFFPPMRLSGRQYPDAYFDVRLNDGGQARTVTYRIWERPGGVVLGMPICESTLNTIRWI